MYLSGAAWRLATGIACLITVSASQERLGADDEQDGVFVDYCSFSQKAFDVIPDAYFDSTRTQKPMQDRTLEQRLQFKFAMGEMTRLYAFEQCEVCKMVTGMQNL